MIVFFAVSVIVFIIWSLFAYWGSRPKPVTYVIQDVKPNTGHMMDICDTPNITVLENAVTGQIQYKCGNLGKTNEVITFYE
jgi:hypothetical protein